MGFLITVVIAGHGDNPGSGGKTVLYEHTRLYFKVSECDVNVLNELLKVL